MLNGNGNGNGNKINESNWLKNKFADAAHVFVHFFAIVLQGYNAINRYGEIVVFAHQKFYYPCSCSVLLFFKLIFTLLASSISHFLTAAVKFSCFSSNEGLLLCFQSLAQALIKNNAKKELTLWLFFLSKSPSGHPISRQKYLELPVVSYMYQLF